jgi:hypothetical protein
VSAVGPKNGNSDPPHISNLKSIGSVSQDMDQNIAVAVAIEESVEGDCSETNTDGDLCNLRIHVAISSSQLLMGHHMSDSHKFPHDDCFLASCKGFHMGGKNRFSTLCCELTWTLYLHSTTISVVPTVEEAKILVQIFCRSLYHSLAVVVVVVVVVKEL